MERLLTEVCTNTDMKFDMTTTVVLCTMGLLFVVVAAAAGGDARARHAVRVLLGQARDDVVDA